MTSFRHLLVLLGLCLTTACAGISPLPVSSSAPHHLSQRLSHGWWASAPLTVAEIEQQSLDELKESPSAPQVPFGYANAEWEALKALMQPGDVLVELGFARRMRSGELDLQTGYALVRNDAIIAEIVTLVT